MVTVTASKSVQTVVVSRERTAEIERVHSEQVVADADRQAQVVERNTRTAAAASTGLQGPPGPEGPPGPQGEPGQAGLPDVIDGGNF